MSRALSCPHCSTRLERNQTIYGNFGCPIKVCTGCGETLIDPAIKEPALKTPFAFRATVILDILRIILVVWIMSLVFGYFIFELFANMGYSWQSLAFGTVVALVLLFARRRRSTIDSEYIRQQIAESIARLDDPTYKAFLAEARIYIYEDSIYCIDRGRDKANYNPDGNQDEA